MAKKPYRFQVILKEGDRARLEWMCEEIGVPRGQIVRWAIQEMYFQRRGVEEEYGKPAQILLPSMKKSKAEKIAEGGGTAK